MGSVDVSLLKQQVEPIITEHGLENEVTHIRIALLMTLKANGDAITNEDEVENNNELLQDIDPAISIQIVTTAKRIVSTIDHTMRGKSEIMNLIYDYSINDLRKALTDRGGDPDIILSNLPDFFLPNGETNQNRRCSIVFYYYDPKFNASIPIFENKGKAFYEHIELFKNDLIKKDNKKPGFLSGIKEVQTLDTSMFDESQFRAYNMATTSLLFDQPRLVRLALELASERYPENALSLPKFKSRFDEINSEKAKQCVICFALQLKSALSVATAAANSKNSAQEIFDNTQNGNSSEFSKFKNILTKYVILDPEGLLEIIEGARIHVINMAYYANILLNPGQRLMQPAIISNLLRKFDEHFKENPSPVGYVTLLERLNGGPIFKANEEILAGDDKGEGTGEGARKGKEGKGNEPGEEGTGAGKGEEGKGGKKNKLAEFRESNKDLGVTILGLLNLVGGEITKQIIEFLFNGGDINGIEGIEEEWLEGINRLKEQIDQYRTGGGELITLIMFTNGEIDKHFGDRRTKFSSFIKSSKLSKPLKTGIEQSIKTALDDRLGKSYEQGKTCYIEIRFSEKTELEPVKIDLGKYLSKSELIDGLTSILEQLIENEITGIRISFVNDEATEEKGEGEGNRKEAAA